MSPPTVKPLIIAGWILLALEALFVISLALQKNMGDDAAGRGMATGFAMLLGPIVLIAGALFIWGTRGGPKVAFWVGFCMIASPVAYRGYTLATGMLITLNRSIAKAEFGRFDDPKLTSLARAIDSDDTTAVRQLLAASPTDWTVRDHRDQTILGHAIVKALDDYGGTRPEAVLLLLEAGAPPAMDAISPGRTSASVSEHNLVYHLYGVHTARALAILEMVLAAGASPNTVDEDGRPIYYSTYTVLPALEILARHGADFTLLDPRTDQLKYNALMTMVGMQMWDEARFFLQQGLSPDYTAPDGQSTRTILAEVDPSGSTYSGADEAAHSAFLAELAKHAPPR